MYDYNRVLVGLDLTEIDKTVIQYTDFLCNTFNIDKVYFMHIAKSLDLPEELVSKHPDLIAPVDETIERQVEDNVKRHFTSSVEYSIEIKEGNPTDQIMRWADFKEIDLVVMGQKHSLKGTGTLPDRIVKSSHCSVLFVPENIESPALNKVVLPLDFSKTGDMVLELAGKLQQATDCKLLLHHSYQVPTGYHSSGKSYEEFADIMKGHALSQAKEYAKKHKLDSDLTIYNMTLDDDHDPSDQIEELALAENADMVIIGSKGRSDIASLLIGSVAEKVCKRVATIPVLVVKDKHQNMGFLDALLKL